jgi:hypothetical protein
MLVRRKWEEAKEKHEPIVYYMAHAEYKGAVKIGTTVNAGKRIRQYQLMRKDDAYFILAVEPGGESLEKLRQIQFLRYQINHDWFFMAGELRQHILELIDSKFQPQAEQDTAE